MEKRVRKLLFPGRVGKGLSGRDRPTLVGLALAGLVSALAGLTLERLGLAGLAKVGLVRVCRVLLGSVLVGAVGAESRFHENS